jgi:hypothetical protein
MGTTLVQLIINLISGGVGGNIAGAVLKNFNLGPAGTRLSNLSVAGWAGDC